MRAEFISISRLNDIKYNYSKATLFRLEDLIRKV